MPEDMDRYRDVTLLLVEDDDVDAMGVERALRQRKILNPLLRARDGIEALEILQTLARPYMILMDLNMPRMGGLELLQHLRDDPRLCDSVVFVLTTSKTDEDLTAAYRSHVAGYIVKSDIGRSFSEVVNMLDSYWRIVALPNGHKARRPSARPDGGGR